MASRNCENCIHYQPKIKIQTDPRPYEEILAEYQRRQRPRIYTIPRQEQYAITPRNDNKGIVRSPVETVLPLRAVFKNDGQREDGINGQLHYDENGRLSLEGQRLGRLPGTLTIDINERLIEWDVAPDKKERLANFEFLLVPFEQTMSIYSNFVTPNLDRNALVQQGKLVAEALRNADKGGREILEGNPVGFGAMDCLIIKERVPNGGLGPDRLRINLGQSYAENIIIERVVRRRASHNLDNAVNLTPLLRRGLRRLYILPGDKPAVIPWANTLQAEGFLNHHEEVRPDGSHIMKGESYERLQIEPLIQADNKEIELAMKASQTIWDQKTQSNIQTRATYIALNMGGVPIEEVSSVSMPVVEEVPSDWTRLPKDALHNGLVTIQKQVTNPRQDLGAFILINVNGTPTLFYIEPTNHGAINKGNREYKSILENPALIQDKPVEESGVTADENTLRLSRLQDLAKKWHIESEKTDRETKQVQSQDPLDANDEFGM